MEDLDNVKSVLQGVLISSKSPMTTQNLLVDYRQLEGHECPYSKFGYRNFIAFLQSIPDILTVLPNGMVKAVSTKKVAHIQHLVALQKKPKSKSRRSYGFRGSYSYSAPPRSYRSDFKPHQSTSRASNYSTWGFPSWQSRKGHSPREVETPASMERLALSSSLPAGPSVVEPEDTRIRRIIVPERESSDESDDSFYERFRDQDDSDHEESGVLKRQTDTNENDSLKVPVLNACSQWQSSSTISEKLKINLRNLIKSYPDGIWACLLPEKYEEKYKVNLNWNELGFDSVVQMAHDLSEVFTCKRVRSGDWMLFDASLPASVDHNENENSIEHTADPVVPDIVKVKIYHIVKWYTSGIRAEQLVQLYQEHYGKSLCSDAPGFANDQCLLTSIHDTVIRLRWVRKDCYVYPGVKPEEVEMPILNVDLESKKRLGLYPDEVMGPGESYIPPQLPEGLEIGKYIELQVAEIYCPHKFWIILREYYMQLEGLMDELQNFYRDHGDKYIMPESTIIEELCCTAIYLGEWHRVTIKSVSEKVEVFYVDYGTTEKVSRNELRFLHRDFSVLPSQGIRGSLCGIQPPNGRQRFTREANHAFLELVLQKDLIGLVQRVDAQELMLELFLIDTNGDTDIHVNDVLVAQNHASFKSDLLETVDELEDGERQDVQSFSSETCALTSTSTSPPTNVVLTQTSSTLSTVSCTSSNISSMPPLGFPAARTPVPPGLTPMNMNLPGMLAVGTNPMLNSSSATFPASNVSQMNAAVLLHYQLQQQQQALMMYYQYHQNLYQQSAASLLAAQSKSSSYETHAMPPGNPWLGTPIQTHQQYFNTQQYIHPSNMMKSNFNPAVNHQAQHFIQGDNHCTDNVVVSPGRASMKSPSQELQGSHSSTCARNADRSSSSSRDSETSCDDSNKKTKKFRKRRSNSNIQLLTPPLQSQQEDTSFCERINNPTDINNIESSTSSVTSKVEPCSGLSASDLKKEPTRKGFCLIDGSYSSDSLDSIQVDCLEDLMLSDSSVKSAPSSSYQVAPDIVQSVANLSLSVCTYSNCWKIVKICGESLYLFNIDEKAFVSTGELVCKFTKFSSLDDLVKTLRSHDCQPAYKCFSRDQRLPLFSELDGCPEDVIKSFGLRRHTNDSVVGILHLTPLTNIPSMFINLGMELHIIKEFGKLRDSFDLNGSYWTR